MDRDESESDKLGQRLRDTFHRADMFIDARDEPRMRRDIERTLAIIFGDPFQTPTRDEHALFAAEGGSRRSAELGRQVGAAIATSEGSVVALGTNEVPAPGGGLYWEDDIVGREFHRKVDSNDEKQREIAEEIGRELLRRGLIDQIQTANTEALREAMLNTSLGDLTEFGRAVHAEMSALLDAASRGVAVKDCTLFSTTFPCHNCARHIIAAGIRRVVYVAPYAKSQAAELHADAIEVASASPTPSKVQFEPFVGVAPRRYLELFDAEWRGRSDRHIARKDKKTGAVQQFVKATANPVFMDVEPRDLRPVTAVYRVREAHAVKFMEERGLKTGLGLPSETSDGPKGTTPRPNPSTEGNA
jgi:cytidine deaminase